MYFSCIFFILVIHNKKYQVLLSFNVDNICTITLPLDIDPLNTESYVYMLTEIPIKEHVDIDAFLNYNLIHPERCHYFDYSKFGHYFNNKICREEQTDSIKKNYTVDKIFIEKSIIINPSNYYYITGIHSRDDRTVSNLYITSRIRFIKRKPIYSVHYIDILHPGLKNKQIIPYFHNSHIISPHVLLEIQKKYEAFGQDFARFLMFYDGKTTPENDFKIE
ncbi:putative SP-containing protein [Vairimorpha necatrix]|uniref:SP-containing protein n=1 Tax=Vairimorpha necatrix TaxID=6039 RepID=A0AAX4JB83_9MICR